MATAVTRAMLIDHLRTEFDMQKDEATAIFDCLVDKVRADLESGKTVNIKNFGTFSVKVHKGHKVQDVNTRIGETSGEVSLREISDYNVVKFVPARALKEIVNGGVSAGGTRRTVKVEKSGLRKAKKRGRPRHKMTQLEKMRREVALQMIEENMYNGKVLSTAEVARSTEMPVHVIAKWRNEADLSLDRVRAYAESIAPSEPLYPQENQKKLTKARRTQSPKQFPSEKKR